MPHVKNGPADVWWEEDGEGDPLLLVMGQGFGSSMWHRAVAPLAEHYRVLTFDNRGIGRSRGSRHRFTIADLASDAVAVLDAAGVDTAHVYGVSMGGLTAQELALSHPERVRSLVLGCTGAPAADAVTPTRRRQLRQRVPRSLLLRLPGVVGALHGPAADPARVREDLAVVRSTPTRSWALAQQARAIAAFSSRDRVAGLAVPTLVVHGDADRVVPLARGEELMALVPGSRLVVLEGAGHNYLADLPETANQVVLDFLAEQRTRATS